MKKILKVFRPILLVFGLLIFQSQESEAQNSPRETDTGSEGINEQGLVSIGGVEQYISIKGDDLSNPVVLFLHGGPGSPLSPYSGAIFGDWEKDFVLVQWDQRGAGKTYGTYAPAELDPEFLKAHPLGVDVMVNDGIEVVEYIRERLGKEKVFLLGTSWGSVLGVKMAASAPEYFYAYLGHSQVVNPSEDFGHTYYKLVKMVTEAKDEEAVEILKNIGPPPYDKARNAGMFIRVIKTYEKLNSAPWPNAWGEIAAEYKSPQEMRHRADGDDYSFLSYVGDKNYGIVPMANSINLLEQNTEFAIPIYVIQGEADLLTPKEISRKYFDALEAPVKEFILVPNAAHGFTPEVVDALYHVLISRR